MSNLSSLIRPNVGRAFLWTALMALSVAPGQIRGSAVSVTACAQNSNNIFLTCTSNTDGSLLSATTSASGINGNPFVNTSTASAAGEVVSFGELGVFASTSWNNPHNASLGDSAYTYAIVSDVLHFAGLSSGTISFTYQLDGSSTQSLDGQGFSQYWLAMRSQAFGNRFWGEGDGAPPSSVTLAAAFSGGVLAYSLQLEAEVRTDNVIGTLDETVDFLHTATLTGVQVFDSQGNAVNDLIITADSGFSYPSAPTSAVPEPIVMPVAGLFLIGILFVTRRRSTEVGSSSTPPANGNGT
jgi:hypothetical protein